MEVILVQSLGWHFHFLALLQVLADFKVPAEPVEHRLRQQLEGGRQRGGCRRPQLLKVLEPTSDLATKPEYQLPSGGYDLGKRLADVRNEDADMVALNPDTYEQAGDDASTKSQRLTIAALPISVAVLLAALAQPFRKRRLPLLIGGLTALTVGVVVALAVELGA